MSRRKRIQDRMKQLQLTYKQIAIHVMLPEKAIKAWVENNKKLSYNSVWAICDILNCDVVDMMFIL